MLAQLRLFAVISVEVAKRWWQRPNRGMRVLLYLDRQSEPARVEAIRKAAEVSRRSLHTVLARLERDGLVWSHPEELAGSERRWYRITEHGRVRVVLWKRKTGVVS